mgnify:CR=1 FL=1
MEVGGGGVEVGEEGLTDILFSNRCKYFTFPETASFRNNEWKSTLTSGSSGVVCSIVIVSGVVCSTVMLIASVDLVVELLVMAILGSLSVVVLSSVTTIGWASAGN